MGVTRECRVAFVGAGYMTREHARAFAAVEGVRLVGITSRTRGRAEALAAELGIESVSDSVAAMYESQKPDLVVVSVPELSMRAVALEAFEHPWTILLEKPAGYHLADAEAIAAGAAKAAGRVFVAFNRRFYGSTERVRADLGSRDGARFVVIQDQQSVEGALQIGQPKIVAENFMYANSIHMIDLGRFVCRGRVSAVRPIVEWNGGSPVVVAMIEFDSGDRALYEGIWDGPGPWAVTVSTPAVRWELRPLERATRQLRGERQLTHFEAEGPDTSFKAGILRQAEEAVRAARGEPTTLPDIAESMESMRLVAAIFGHRPHTERR